MGVLPAVRVRSNEMVQRGGAVLRGATVRATRFVRGHRDLRSIIIVWATLYLLFGDGMGFRVPVDGARGLVLFGQLMTIGLAAYALYIDGGTRHAITRLAPRRIPFVVAFLALDATASLLGVVLGAPVHLVTAVLQPIALAAWIVLGVALVQRHPETLEADMTKVLIGTGVVQGIVGLVQVVFGYVGPGRILLPWMLHLQNLHGSPVFSRASGLYLGANAFSLFGAMLFAWGCFAHASKKQRLVLVTVGTFIVLSGSSRSALAALVAVLAAWVFLHRREMLAAPLITMGSAALAAIATVAIVAFTSFGRRLVGRVVSVVDGAIGRGVVDPDVGARFDGWGRVFKFVWAHPSGTLAPPGRVLGLIDSDYMYVLAHGGWLLLGSFIAALIELLVQAWRSSTPAAFRALVLVVALTGISQYSSGYVPTAAILWLLIGTLLWDSPPVPEP